jgi:hypothetical protein
VIPGKFYQIGRCAKIGIPVMFAHIVISAASMFGAINLTIITYHPMAIVAFTSCGAIFFNGLDAILGDNILESTSKTIGWTLNLPIKGVEVLLNRLVLFPITFVTGFPLLLNANAEQNSGPGISITTAKEIYVHAHKKYGKKFILWIAKKLNITL